MNDESDLPKLQSINLGAYALDGNGGELIMKSMNDNND